ncbi:MAG: sigma-70 family RNA polymerase sigma factor [Puia sp.]
MDKIQQETDQLYKQHFGKLVASLLYASRDIDPETAEDIVQDAFSAALIDWRLQGIPANSAGWLYKVCRNKALNKIKKDKRLEPLTEKHSQAMIENRFSESAFDDQQLKLLFACAHPDLAPKTQVAITLKYVVNLRVESIAKNLAMTIDGVDKLLLRARQKIRDEKILLEEPHPNALKQRLPIVHKIIYLTYNEGYKATAGKEILREDLCEEALLLNKALLESSLSNKETAALHALMLFNSARFKSRISDTGELLDLENQDRSTWNRDLIQLGHDFFSRSQGEMISTYHLEAAIACLHCIASSFEKTDWQTIVGLYARLLQIFPNPFVELNYAIAKYYAGDKNGSLKILNELRGHTFLNQYYLLNMAIGKFQQMEGNHTLARQHLLKAQQQTTLQKEKDFIEKMLDKIPDPG